MEVAEHNVVRIIFFKPDRYDVEHAIRNLYDETVKTFGKVITDTMLSEQDINAVKFSHQAELDHTQKLLHMTGNPQGPEDSPAPPRRVTKKVNLYYGSYLEVTKGDNSKVENTTTHDDNTVSSMQQSMQSLMDRQEALENNLQSTVDNAIDKKLAPVREEISELKRESTSMFGSILDRIEAIQDNQNTTIASTVRRIMSEFFPENTTAQNQRDQLLAPNSLADNTQAQSTALSLPSPTSTQISRAQQQQHQTNNPPSEAIQGPHGGSK